MERRYTPQDSLALTRLMYDIRMSWGMKFAGPRRCTRGVSW